ncbi:MAG: hypothetical protein PVH87_15340 [Desulfobacteraceae bacterium]|jgi:hypothetical protein
MKIEAKIGSWIVLLLFSLSISISAYYSLRRFSLPKNTDSITTYYVGKFGKKGLQSLRQEWRSRVFSNYLASLFFPGELKLGEFKISPARFSAAVGVWVGIWLFLTNLVYICFDRKKAILHMLITYAAVITAYYGIGGMQGHRPWDMPILCFSTLIVFLALSNNSKWLIGLIPLSMGFKETAVVLAPLILLDGRYKIFKKIILTCVTVGIALLVKYLLDQFVDNTTSVFTATVTDEVLQGQPRFYYNLKAVASFYFTLFFTINVGSLLFFILLPLQRNILVLKGIAAVFIISLFLYGMVYEIRIWFELLPISLAGLHIWQSPELKKELGIINS